MQSGFECQTGAKNLQKKEKNPHEFVKLCKRYTTPNLCYHSSASHISLTNYWESRRYLLSHHGQNLK